MADTTKTSFGTKIAMAWGIFVILFGAYKCVGSFSDSSNKGSTDINLDNVAEVQQAIQGKWNESLPSSVSSESIYFRLLIEGNKISIYEKIGFGDWDMSTPDEVHTFTVGEKTKTVDGVPCRYLYYDDEETLLTRSIGTLHVTDCCILFRGSVRILSKGWD